MATNKNKSQLPLAQERLARFSGGSTPSEQKSRKKSPRKSARKKKQDQDETSSDETQD